MDQPFRIPITAEMRAWLKTHQHETAEVLKVGAESLVRSDGGGSSSGYTYSYVGLAGTESILINLYTDATNRVGWHADKVDNVTDGWVTSMSFALNKKDAVHGRSLVRACVF